MNKSLAKIKQQIEKLQREAASLQSGVIARIRKEIEQHGLTAEDLFGGSAGVSSRSGRGRATGARRSKADGVAKYADGNGNSWGGRGKRPQWIHAALEAGKSLDDFLVGRSGQGPSEAMKPVDEAPKRRGRAGQARGVARKAAKNAPEKAVARKTAGKAERQPAAKSKAARPSAKKATNASRPAAKKAAAKPARRSRNEAASGQGAAEASQGGSAQAAE
jgi:DNA-binding protein H-NS